MKLTLKQGFILIDETCAKHASVIEGLQSFAGAEIGANQRLHETLQRLSSQMGALQHKTLELEKNTSLDWRMQSIEEDINTLQNRLRGGTLRLLNALNSEDRGLKVRFSLAMIVFETFELILCQMLSSQGKKRTFRPLSSLFSAFSSLKVAKLVDKIG